MLPAKLSIIVLCRTASYRTCCLFPGVVKCGVEYGPGDFHWVDSDPYYVIPLPSVTVEPLAVSVVRDREVVVQCRLSADSRSSARIFWLKDGKNLTKDDGLSHTHRRIGDGGAGGGARAPIKFGTNIFGQLSRKIRVFFVQK